MYESLGFSRFRELMDIADMVMIEDEAANKLKHVFDSQGMILFFKKGNDYYGAGEDSRVVFAKLKHPDEEMPSGWEEEANFTAVNLSGLVKGHPTNHVFDGDDLKGIKVVDRQDVIDELKGKACEETPRFGGIRFVSMSRHDRDDAPNFSRADEE